VKNIQTLAISNTDLISATIHISTHVEIREIIREMVSGSCIIVPVHIRGCLVTGEEGSRGGRVTLVGVVKAMITLGSGVANFETDLTNRTMRVGRGRGVLRVVGRSTVASSTTATSCCLSVEGTLKLVGG
jgi:hypothetical protein